MQGINLSMNEQIAKTYLNYLHIAVISMDFSVDMSLVIHREIVT